MPNRYLALHPRFLANFKITIAAPFNANSTKTVAYIDSALKGLRPDMVVLAQVDGVTGAIVTGASCAGDDTVDVVFLNDGPSGAKANLTLTVVGL